jgi:hypothetical protein
MADGTGAVPSVRGSNGRGYSDLRSVSKSVVGLPVGIARQQGKIDIGASPLAYYPRNAYLRSPTRDAITVEHLACQTATPTRRKHAKARMAMAIRLNVAGSGTAPSFFSRNETSSVMFHVVVPFCIWRAPNVSTFALSQTQRASGAASNTDIQYGVPGAALKGVLRVAE